jgi:hypothetical protein
MNPIEAQTAPETLHAMVLHAMVKWILSFK